MKYIYNEELNLSIEERILNINNLTKEDIDVSNFECDYNLEIINGFKEKIFEYKDLKFLIVGDYDCDGICATTIIKKLLDSLKIENNYYIPSRSKEGYGLNEKIVNTAKDNGFGVLIMVDNGVNAIEQLELAHSYNLKTIIIDHHEYTNEPNCDYFVHPNLFNDKYHNMCAAGLCALLSNSYKEDEINFVYGGIATLADMVEVLNYNRYLIQAMYKILKDKDIRPISLLLGDGDVYSDIQFNVIPKINSVSRLDEFMNVNYVVKYLLSRGQECNAYYEKIETINECRKQLTKLSCDLANKLIDINENIIIIASRDFKEGLCGVIANKLMYEYGKAVIVLAKQDDMLHGSGRSPQGTNIYDYLCAVKDIFTSFGGHAQACGLSLSVDNYDKLLQYIKQNVLEYEEGSRDVLVLKQDEINEDTLKQIDELRPFGPGLEEPYIGVKNANILSQYLVAGKYPKYTLNDKLEAISFNSNHINKKFSDIIGKLKQDNYHKDSISITIEELL